MHWNGTNWTTMKGPKIKVPKRDYAFATDIAVLGPKDIWLEYSVGGIRSGGPPFALELVHWNGKAWRQRQLVPFRAFANDGFASDGHGGLWLATEVRRPFRAPRLLHYAGGRWTEEPTPGKAKHPTVPTRLTWVPGTKSLLAGGTIGIAGVSPVQGVVLTYGP
jgi:hypothetical protein